MKKLFILLLVYSSMGFTVANDCKPTKKDTQTNNTPVYGYLEVSSPAYSSITLSR